MPKYDGIAGHAYLKVWQLERTLSGIFVPLYFVQEFPVATGGAQGARTQASDGALSCVRTKDDEAENANETSKNIRNMSARQLSRWKQLDDVLGQKRRHNGRWWWPRQRVDGSG